MILCSFNQFKQNGISNSYQLDQSISILRVFECNFSFLPNFNFAFSKQTMVSDLGLHCLPVSHKKDAWNNE